MQPPYDASWTEELCTLADWLRFTVSEMRRTDCALGQGCMNSMDEARWLVYSSLALPIDFNEPSLECAKLTQQERETLATALRRRTVDREPTAYILKEAWLRGFRFKSDQRAIIPRSFLAEWLSPFSLPNIQDTESPLKVLDLCTGSGCLAILSAMALPNSQVWALDISKQALSLAHENVQNYKLGSRISLVEGNGLKALGGLDPRPIFDLIVCNPPYVNTLLGDYGHFLASDGSLLLEIGHELAAFNQLIDRPEFKSLPVSWLETELGEPSVVQLFHPASKNEARGNT
jgi:ribosomal protein L3 glutamine methyltransferase